MLRKVLWVVGILFVFNVLLNVLINAFPTILGILGVAVIVFIIYKFIGLIHRGRYRDYRQTDNPQSRFGGRQDWH